MEIYAFSSCLLSNTTSLDSIHKEKGFYVMVWFVIFEEKIIDIKDINIWAPINL